MTLGATGLDELRERFAAAGIALAESPAVG